MSSRLRPTWTGAMWTAALLLTGIAGSEAQVERSGGGANALLVQQYQQLLTERTALQADNDKMKRDLERALRESEASAKQLTALQAAGSTAQAQLAAAQQAGRNAAQQLEESKARLQELVDRFRETATNLRDVESERSSLQQQLMQGKRDFDQCAERNYQLFEVDAEVLDRYEHQGVFAHLAKAEPFTQLKRAQIENLVDEYRARAEELRVRKAAAPPTAAASPAPEN